tara:strand:- start:2723 stop:3289 length:567 start_codon:yes stop_codon:yes gene_type:complete
MRKIFLITILFSFLACNNSTSKKINIDVAQEIQLNEYDSKAFSFSYPEEYYISDRRLTSADFEVKLLSYKKDITFTINPNTENLNQIKYFYDDSFWQKSIIDLKKYWESRFPNSNPNIIFERVKMHGKDFIKLNTEVIISTNEFYSINFIFIENNKICASTIGASSKKDLKEAIEDLDIIYESIYLKE